MGKQKAVTRRPVKSLVLKEKDSIQKTHIEAGPVDVTPDNMIMIALQSGRSMEEIGKLIELRNNEIARLARINFSKAKSKFQGLIEPVRTNRGVDHNKFNETGKAKYNFADLAAVELAVKPHLVECGFTYDWKTRYDGDYIYVKCILSHIDGHSESDELRAKTDKTGGKNDIQADISTTSYLRRVTLKGVLGLSTEDDDGQKAKYKTTVVDQQQNEEWSQLPIPTDAQYNELMRNVIQGKATVDSAMQHFFLSEQREKALRIAEESKGKQTPPHP